MGNEVIDRQECAFKNYESDQASQRAKERNGEQQNDACAENVGNDLTAPIEAVVVLHKQAKAISLLLQAPDVADDA